MKFLPPLFVVDMNGNIACLQSLDNNLEVKTKGDADIQNEDKDLPGDDKKRNRNDVETADEVSTKKSKVGENGISKEKSNIFNEEKQSKAREELTNLVGKDSAEEAIKMLVHWESEDKIDDEQYAKNVTFPFIDDKEKRKAIHILIRSDVLSCCSVADTFDKKVRIWHKKFEKEMPNYGAFSDQRGKNNKKSSNKQKVAWPRDRPNFLRFVLYKENVDTGTAARDIAYAARLPPKGKGGASMGYAGMKDKRGITSQFCTIYRKTPETILTLNSRDNKSNAKRFGGGNTRSGGSSIIKVGNFEYVDKDIRLGELSGNRFDIVLRNVCIDSEQFKSEGKLDEKAHISKTREYLITSCNAMKENGFINYFGMQRFGKFHDTHEVGIAVLKGCFEKACDIILRVKDSEDEKHLKVRKEWESRFDNVNMNNEDDVRSAEKNCARSVMKKLGRFMTCESSIVNGLSRNPRDYKRAFQCIPKNLRSMFLHAYQSYLWNKVVSDRIATGGSRNAIIGDLVLVENKSESEGGGGTSGLKGKEVKILMEDDIKSNKYSIEDVVLPLVGSRVKYPTNSSGEMYDALLKEDGLSKADFNKMDDRELSLCGDYRKIVIRPDDIEFEIKAYRDPLQPLLKTDLMKLHNAELDCIDLTNGDTELTSQENDMALPLIGMIIGFTLPASSYATIALRELMRRPTSSEYQSTLRLEGNCTEKTSSKELDVE